MGREAKLIVYMAGVYQVGTDGSVELLEGLMHNKALPSATRLLQAIEKGPAVAFDARKSAPLLGKRQYNLPKYFATDGLEPKAQAAALRNLAYLTPLQSALKKRQRIPYPDYQLVIRRVSVEIGDTRPPSARSLARLARSWVNDDFSSRTLVPASFGVRRQHRTGLGELLVNHCTRVLPLIDSTYTATQIRGHVELLSKALESQLGVAIGDPPSLSAVRRKMRELSFIERFQARQGKKAAKAALEFFSPTTAPVRLLERVEIDHHQIDLFVADDTTAQAIGKPWLTLAICCASRCIVGYWITLNDPSSESVKHCLELAMLPRRMPEKPALPTVREWKQGGAIEFLVADNGADFRGKQLASLCHGVGMELCFPPSYTPYMRGTVERQFLTAIKKLFSALPGFDKKQSVYERERHPSEGALITLSELQDVFHVYVVDDYHIAPQAKLFGKSPSQVWDAMMDAGLGPGTLDESMRYQYQGNKVTRRLDKNGIQIEYLIYNSADLSALRAQHGNVMWVDVYEPYVDVSQLVAIHPVTKEPFAVPCTDQAYSRGLTRHQHLAIRKFAKSSGMKTVTDAERAKAKMAVHNYVVQKQASKTMRDRKKASVLRGAAANEPAPSGLREQSLLDFRVEDYEKD